jgi:hypothetical protein
MAKGKTNEFTIEDKMAAVDSWYETYQMYFTEKALPPDEIKQFVKDIREACGTQFNWTTGMWQF